MRPRCSTRRVRFQPRSAFTHESATHVRATGGTSLPTGCKSRHRPDRYGTRLGIVPGAASRAWASFRSLRCTPGHRSGRYGAQPGIAQAAAHRTNAILPTFPIIFQRPQVDHLFTIVYTAFTWGFIIPHIRYRIHFSFLMGKVGKIARRSFDFALQPPETGPQPARPEDSAAVAVHMHLIVANGLARRRARTAAGSHGSGLAHGTTMWKPADNAIVHTNEQVPCDIYSSVSHRPVAMATTPPTPCSTMESTSTSV